MNRQFLAARAMVCLFSFAVGLLATFLCRGITGLMGSTASNYQLALYSLAVGLIVIPINMVAGVACADEQMSRPRDNPRAPFGAMALFILALSVACAILTEVPPVVGNVAQVVLGHLGLCSLISFWMVGKFAADKGKHSWATLVMFLAYKSGGAPGVAIGIVVFPELIHRFRSYPLAVSMALKLDSLVQRVFASEEKETQSTLPAIWSPAPQSIPAPEMKTTEPGVPIQILLRQTVEEKRSTTTIVASVNGEVKQQTE